MNTHTLAVSLLLLFIYSSCSNQHGSYNDDRFKPDTLQVVQTILNDPDIIKDFGINFSNETLKYINNFSKIKGDSLKFKDKNILAVSMNDDLHTFHEKYPKSLYISVPIINFYSSDSVYTEMYIHAGNSILFLNLAKVEGEWNIFRKQKGKF